MARKKQAAAQAVVPEPEQEYVPIKPAVVDLYPAQAPKGEAITLDLDKLPKTLPGPRPSPSMVRSVQRLGVVKPVVVVEKPGGGYELRDGRRRVLAAREAGLAKVRAVVYTRDDVRPEVLTLTLNAQRSDNAVAELDALRALLKVGASEADIARDTGMPVGTIRRRLRLASIMSEPLWQAVKKGDVAVAVAEAVAKLPPAARDRINDLLEEKGSVSAADVAQERKVRAAASQAELPEEMFEEADASLVRGRIMAVLDSLVGEVERAKGPEGLVVALQKAIAQTNAWKA